MQGSSESVGLTDGDLFETSEDCGTELQLSSLKSTIKSDLITLLIFAISVFV